MSKNSKANRQRRLDKKNRQKAPLPRDRAGLSGRGMVHSAHSLWRSLRFDARLEDLLFESVQILFPKRADEARPSVRMVEQAPDIEALLDLTLPAIGLADVAWSRRMRAFGPEAAEPIAARLKARLLDARPGAREEASDVIQERLIAALRWCDDRGVAAILDLWDALDDYGRSLASMVLGILGARHAADRLWAFHQAMRQRSDNFFVGPLWGLIDLGDSRAADALAELVETRRSFYEKYGFLSRAGDQRVVIPLLVEVTHGVDAFKADAMWALTGVAWRLGPDAFRQTLLGHPGADDSDVERAADVVDRIFAYSQADVERHFQTFYSMPGGGLLAAAQSSPDQGDDGDE